MNEETFHSLKDAGVEGFPIADAWERTPALARAYTLAWFVLFRIASATKESALADGRVRYASEIKAMDCEDHFARLGEIEIDEQLASLFDEVKAFYVSRMAAARVGLS